MLSNDRNQDFVRKADKRPEKNNLKVVCNEMEGGSDTCLFNPYSYGSYVIVFNFNCSVDVVF